jgi:diketogulonate reductase-like aldo/keto reductase
MTEPLDRRTTVRGFSVPTFFYGTAWKEKETERLTSQALEVGFRAIDTANQRKHYFEAGVGAAVQRAITAGLVDRASLFLQSKFTHRPGQDQRLPYDAKADVPTQVAQSFQSSLEHFGTDYLDSYVLHGPSQRRGLAEDDRAALRAMLDLQTSGRARLLGVSNVNLGQLQEAASVLGAPPAFVQNRCFASTGWDRPVRDYCREHGIRYQAFSLLTANSDVLGTGLVQGVAERLGVTPSQVVFRFALEVGMIPLTGTSNAAHARADLAVFDLEPLTAGELEQLAHVGESSRWG